MPPCHAEESSALLRFKDSFVIDCSDPPKNLSWNPRGDCCSWEGVDCDGDGHVIGLDLSSSCLFGPIHSNSSLFELKHLQRLSLAENNFNHSPIPPELALLSTTLTHLDLSWSYFAGHIPSEISMLSKLVFLRLGSNVEPSSSTSYLQLKKPIFTSLVQNLTKLQVLVLSFVNISSTVPNTLSNLSSLSVLYLKHCNLVGEFPSSVFLLPNLVNISIRYNEELTGHLPHFNQSQLKLLKLSHTSFSGELPDSIQNLPSLRDLDVSKCYFSGPIPSSLGNLTNLTYLDLGSNLLQGPVQNSLFSRLVNLKILFLSGNNFRGSLPSPPPSITIYSVRNSQLTGEIPALLCNLSSLVQLELQHNDLSGQLPRCLSNMSDLSQLTINDNSFSGTIPDMCTNRASILEGMDLSQNQLQGKIPRSLANCSMLRGIDVGRNAINDTFPLWMGNLQGLQLLILRSNRFHGPILESSATPNSSWFPNLRIIDLSHNGFSGLLPSALFCKWKAMKNSNPINFTYMRTNETFGDTIFFNAFSMTLANKGSELEYRKIPDNLAAIDFSSNNFDGEVPESIGNLKGLYVLNLSNNHLRGPIPYPLANLTVLESLDLSNNKLSGEIPQQLAQLNYLAYLNLSHNNLVGKVPRGKQFDTFSDSSFDGNSGLCGELLTTKRCRGLAPPSSAPVCSENCEDVESSFPSKSDWIGMIMGYVGGLVVGVVVGNTIMTKKPKWLVKLFGKKMQPRTRRGKRSCRN